MMVAPLCRNINQSLKWSNFGRRAALLRNAVGIKTTVWVRVMQGRVHTQANAPFKVISSAADSPVERHDSAVNRDILLNH